MAIRMMYYGNEKLWVVTAFRITNRRKASKMFVYPLENNFSGTIFSGKDPHEKYTTDQTESQIQKSAIHTRGLWEERTCACEDLPEIKEDKKKWKYSPHAWG
jgi:hypothetical protein